MRIVDVVVWSDAPPLWLELPAHQGVEINLNLKGDAQSTDIDDLFIGEAPDSLIIARLKTADGSIDTMDDDLVNYEGEALCIMCAGDRRIMDRYIDLVAWDMGGGIDYYGGYPAVVGL